jgi:hypothetical protein
MLSNRARFFENFCNVSHKVLGKRLKPFCALHYLWLEHLDSPLIITSKNVSPADLRLAVAICSQDSSEAILAAINRENKRWIAPKSANLAADVKLFLAYTDDYCSLWEYEDKAGGATVEKLPWLLVAIAAFIKETGYPQEVVWKMPLGQLLAFNSAFSYLQTGEANIVTDTDRAAEAALTSLR